MGRELWYIYKTEEKERSSLPRNGIRPTCPFLQAPYAFTVESLHTDIGKCEDVESLYLMCTLTVFLFYLL